MEVSSRDLLLDPLGHDTRKTIAVLADRSSRHCPLRFSVSLTASHPFLLLSLPPTPFFFGRRGCVWPQARNPETSSAPPPTPPLLLHTHRTPHPLPLPPSPFKLDLPPSSPTSNWTNPFMYRNHGPSSSFSPPSTPLTPQHIAPLDGAGRQPWRRITIIITMTTSRLLWERRSFAFPSPFPRSVPLPPQAHRGALVEVACSHTALRRSARRIIFLNHTTNRPHVIWWPVGSTSCIDCKRTSFTHTRSHLMVEARRAEWLPSEVQHVKPRIKDAIRCHEEGGERKGHPKSRREKERQKERKKRNIFKARQRCKMWTLLQPIQNRKQVWVHEVRWKANKNTCKARLEVPLDCKQDDQLQQKKNTIWKCWMDVIGGVWLKVNAPECCAQGV